ncbi:MAG: glycosyltransferase involved in cell wall biosynthesis [Rhodothermales bacterium]|jgi:glycosyltransferase involved in cell wall biosynthesis
MSESGTATAEVLRGAQAPERPELSIVVPLLDESQSLGELAEKIVVACASIAFEVLFVDDGSTDPSWTTIGVIHAGDPRFGGIRLRRNYGKSAALSIGFREARGRFVVTMDADLQDDPSEIPAMLEKLRGGAHLVSGWKRERQDPLSKTIPSRFFNAITRRLSGIKLHDFNCGLKAYQSDVVKSVRLYGELHRYIPLLAKWEGYDRIEEQVVVHHPRTYGNTKFGLERFLRGFLDLLSVLFLTRFAARPMHFFGMLGTLAFMGGLTISLWLSVEKVFYGRPIGDRPLLLLGVLLILVGIQMFTTGLLGQLIIRPSQEDSSSIAVIGRLGAELGTE